MRLTMDVSKINSQTQSAHHSESIRGSAASGKSPEKEDKAKALDIGFSEKVAQPRSDKGDSKLVGRKVEETPQSLICSVLSCGCDAVER